MCKTLQEKDTSEINLKFYQSCMFLYFYLKLFESHELSRE